MVLADGLHRPGPGIVLPRLGREAIDTLLRQLHRGRRPDLAQVRLSESHLRPGRLNQLVRHDVVVRELEDRAGAYSDGKRRLEGPGVERPGMATAHLMPDRDRRRATRRRRRWDRESGQR